MSLNSRKNHNGWQPDGTRTPEAVVSWRRYANLINQAIAEKWKNGVPKGQQMVYRTSTPIVVKPKSQVHWSEL